MIKASELSFFKGKTVTLLGLGLLGRGIGDAAFLASHCEHVIVTDMKSAHDLAPSKEALSKFSNITFALGGHDKAHFEGVDFVVKGAGVRRDNIYVAHAREKGIPVYMSTALFVLLSAMKTIGVTGTRGKTTTTYMIADILKAGGIKVLLGGNLRGVSTLAQLEEASLYDVALLELDSWQLQGFDDLKISPNISVFTNFYPDHMNYYDGDMKRYLDDKISIFRYQKSDDLLITSPSVKEILDREAPETKLPVRSLIVDKLPAHLSLSVPGGHNIMNGALAKAVGQAWGVSEQKIDDALIGFAGVEGRLQKVGSTQDVDFYNDSNATTQEATLAALRSFDPKRIVLIFGGADKGLTHKDLVAYISRNDIRCVLLKGTGSESISKDLPGLKQVDSMEEAVYQAQKMAISGDKILLSPAFASFGMFKNEYDRSDQFMSEVQKIVAASCPR